MTPNEAALAFRADGQAVGQRAVALIWRLWELVDPAAIVASWSALLPRAAAVLVAAQTVSAELAEPYVATSLATAAAPAASIAADAFAGMADGDLTVLDLLAVAPLKALERIDEGVEARAALRLTRADLGKWTATTAMDAGRLATTTAMTARPEVEGYYRMLSGKSCARCAILAGRFYRLNEGFDRHPRCDCVHRPARMAGDGAAFDARKAIERDDVTGLSRADRRAILEFGADPSQVVNAKAGMYKAGGRKYTRQGTTRRSIAGARILAREAERLQGEDVSRKTFTNLTFSRELALQYSELLRKGRTFTRTTSTGRTQSYSYRLARTPRPTPEAILDEFPDRADALRELKNFGYIL